MNNDILTLVDSNTNTKEILQFIGASSQILTIQFPLMQSVLTHPQRTLDEWDLYMDAVDVLIKENCWTRILQDIILQDKIIINDEVGMLSVMDEMKTKYRNEDESNAKIACFEVVIQEQQISISEIKSKKKPFNDDVWSAFHAFVVTCNDAELLKRMQKKKFNFVPGMSCIISTYFKETILDQIWWLGVKLNDPFNEGKILKKVNPCAGTHYQIMRKNDNKTKFVETVVVPKVQHLYARCGGGSDTLATADIFEKNGPITASEKLIKKMRSGGVKFHGLGYSSNCQVMYNYFLQPFLHYTINNKY